MIIALFFLGSFAIATVLPSQEISLTAGIMQAFQLLLAKFHLEFLVPVMGFLIAFGAIGGVTAWIIGPSKGMLTTAKEGDLPKFLAKENKRGVPSRILIFQGIIVSALSLFYLTEHVSTAFFMLSALTVILYLLMYILLYASAIYLRYKKPKTKRLYKIPGGNLGMWLVAGLGIVSALFAIVVGFFPPAQLTVTDPTLYLSFLCGGVIFFLMIPFLLVYFKRRKRSVLKNFTAPLTASVTSARRSPSIRC